MKPTHGCIVITETNHERQITIGKNCFDISSNGVIIDEQAPTEAKHKYQRIIKVIGHEPMLNDVLEYIMKVDPAGKINYVNFDGLYISGREMEMGVNWDLTKVYLKDQSEIVIDHILKLINEL